MKRPPYGFTLIELLIVIVVLGILATIAIPRFSSVSQRAYFNAMTSDLRHLSTHQELYYTSSHVLSYATSVDLLDAVASPGVTLHITGATSLGWHATASHVSLRASQTCGIYGGTPASYPPPFGDAAGVVKCNSE